MKKLALLLMTLAVFACAYTQGNTFTKKDIKIYMRSGDWNTGDHMTTYPVIVNGEVMCTYEGSIKTGMNQDGSCPEVNVYHLVRIARNKKNLDCFYDYTIGGDFMFVVLNQMNCPDIVAAYNGMNFFQEVYFDTLDSHTFYYDKLLKQTFEGDFDVFPKVKEQIRYRRVHMRKNKANQVITFGED